MIYTAHVIIREAWRGLNLLQKLGARTFLATRLRHPLQPIYWFFDTFSYKSYLLLPRNFREYWPRREERTPERYAALIDQLAAQMYGGAWRPGGWSCDPGRSACGPRLRRWCWVRVPIRGWNSSRAPIRDTRTATCCSACAR